MGTSSPQPQSLHPPQSVVAYDWSEVVNQSWLLATVGIVTLSHTISQCFMRTLAGFHDVSSMMGFFHLLGTPRNPVNRKQEAQIPNSNTSVPFQLCPCNVLPLDKPIVLHTGPSPHLLLSNQQALLSMPMFVQYTVLFACMLQWEVSHYQFMQPTRRLSIRDALRDALSIEQTGGGV